MTLLMDRAMPVGDLLKAAGYAVPARAAVSERKLIGRINRRLTKVNLQLHRTHLSTPHLERRLYGKYYISDPRQHFLCAKDVDPEYLGRVIGALRPWEVFGEEEAAQ